MTTASAIYAGKVVHRRLRPRRHDLSYRVFWLLLDLDELPRLAKRLRLFSLNRFNLLSFHERDHGRDRDGRDPEPLAQRVRRLLAEAGIDTKGGPIRILCMPRILGYVFNPLSVYFCHHPGGEVAAVLYEVSNTFGERHSYLIPVEDTPGQPIEQQCAKAFYVSPFMDLNMNYGFTVHRPADTVSVAVRNSDASGLLFTAALSGQRVDLTDRSLLRMLATHPLLTLKVVAGIHWEALRLWLKGVDLRPRPPAPTSPVTIVRPEPR